MRQRLRRDQRNRIHHVGACQVGAVDMDITRLVDGNVGVHALCPKKIFAGRAAQYVL